MNQGGKESVAALIGPNVRSVENVGIEEVDQRPELTQRGDVETIYCNVSPHEGDEVDRILREELNGSHATSTPVKGLMSIDSKRRSSMLGVQEAPSCNSKRLAVTDKIGAPESGNLSRKYVSEMNGGVADSDFTSGGFST